MMSFSCDSREKHACPGKTDILRNALKFSLCGMQFAVCRGRKPVMPSEQVIKTAEAFNVQMIRNLYDVLFGVDQQTGGMADPQFIDEVSRSFPEIFLKAFAQMSGCAACQLLHAFHSGAEIFLLAHQGAEFHQPVGHLRFAQQVHFINKETGIQFPEQYFQFDFP